MVRPGLPQPQRRPPWHWEQLIAQWANWDRANETYGCHWFGYIAWPSAWSKHDWYYHLTTTPCHPTNHEFKTCCQAPSWHRCHRSRGSQGCTDDPQKLFKPQQLLGNKIDKVQNHSHTYIWIICWLNDGQYSTHGALGVEKPHKMIENEKTIRTIKISYESQNQRRVSN